MDLSEYDTKVVDQGQTLPCTVCGLFTLGYVDVGPVDVLCMGCARRVAGALRSFDAQSPVVPMPTAYRCDTCGRTFARPAALGSHQRAHRLAVLA